MYRQTECCSLAGLSHGTVLTRGGSADRKVRVVMGRRNCEGCQKRVRIREFQQRIVFAVNISEQRREEFGCYNSYELQFLKRDLQV
jgi:hypothetical protein